MVTVFPHLRMNVSFAHAVMTMARYIMNGKELFLNYMCFFLYKSVKTITLTNVFKYDLIFQRSACGGKRNDMRDIW